MRLLERDHPLTVLGDHARRAAGGRGSAVSVAGEAGIGKTVLLRAFAELAPVQVLWGMCDSLSTPRPLGPLRDIAGELGPAVPDVLRGAAVQHEIFAVVLQELRARPRALVFEDLHWADEATLDLVRFVARRIHTLPLLMVLTYRDDVGPAHPLRRVLGDLVSTPDGRRLQLTPLSLAAVGELVGEHGLDPADVHARTAGNPFFVSQILAQPDRPLPDSVRDAVVARTAALPSPARHALELLSCTPEPVSGELLAALGVRAASVETLATTGLLDRHGTGVMFRHEIARSAVLGSVVPGAETALHTAMIEALEEIGGDASVIAHHAAAAPDVVRILRYAPLAGAAAAGSGSHREAVAFYELALRHAGEDDPATRATLMEALATELLLSDRLHDAIAVCRRALHLRRELGDVVAVGAAHLAISQYQWYAADRVAAERHDDAAITILAEAGAPRELGYALANHAFLASQRGDAAEAMRAGGQAQRIADELDDAALASTASIGPALVRLLGGDQDARIDLLAVRDAGLRLRSDVLASAPVTNLAHVDVEQGRFAEAEDVLLDALRFSGERDVPGCNMWQLGVRARLRLLQGRWADAEHDALAVLAAGDLPLGRLWSHLVLGLLAARRDAPAENPHLDELWSLTVQLDLPGLLAPAAAALTEQAWITRRPDPRLDGQLVGELMTLPSTGGEQLRRWTRRLTAEGAPPPVAAPPAVPEQLPYEQAMALWDVGSPETLLAALPLLDELDARSVTARVRGRLRELGMNFLPRGRSPATRSNPAGLTGRQLDVLALLVEGLSNTEVAARLVISRRTADHHVSAILGRLNARSRGEAVAAAHRLGLARVAPEAEPSTTGSANSPRSTSPSSRT
ncbi:ATP-binding protein [Pseudonocardia lacus]|uniref:ATP-binding protein n=1 Tax=Pseudonocardia lacus TaxID=2835865 RepID=UPI001BDBC99A|nr:LuxR family transcriptional regulator [Pseudonocardia lacus]